MLDDPPGVLVSHTRRIDGAGRLALTRLDANLKPVRSAELPLRKSDTTRRDPYFVSIDLATGAMQATQAAE